MHGTLPILLLISINYTNCRFFYTFINKCYPLTILHNATGRNYKGRDVSEVCILTPMASCWIYDDKYAKTSYFYTSDHYSATHAVFIAERHLLKYGIDLSLGFDLPMEIMPVWVSERTYLPAVSCNNSTCFGFTKINGTASQLVTSEYHKAPIRGSAFNITLCSSGNDDDVVENDDYLDYILE